MLYHAEREIEVACPPEVFLDVAWAFDEYPQFVTGIAASRLIKREDAKMRIEVTAKLMGIPFRYELECVREPRRVRWARVAGAFALAEGSWTLVDAREGRCKMRYENAVDPGIPAPRFIVSYVLDTSLPKLLKEFQTRAEATAKKRAASPPPPPTGAMNSP